MGQGCIGIIEAMVLLPEIGMARDTGKAIVLLDRPDQAFPMVLAYRLQRPWYDDVVKVSSDGGDAHQFVIAGAYPNIGCLLFHDKKDCHLS